MTRLGIAAAAAGLALLTFFQFPGHTWLQQDTQIYVPILEHLRDPSVLARDIVAAHPHVRFTLYDETARGLSAAAGLDFRAALEFEQIATRALGIWGLFLCATAVFGSGAGPVALLVAGICSLGASIVGPQVLTVEYEPTPRAFAIPLILCAIGLAAHRRYLAAGIAGAGAFLYHPPTALPFWALYIALAVWPGKREVRRARLWGLAALGAAVPVLLAAAALQTGDGEAQVIFGRLTPLQEQLQRMRAPYVWISMFPAAVVLHYAIIFAIAMAAYARLRRELPAELRVFFVGLPVLGMLSMPVSWLLLERMKWALVPQLQPLRTLLFVTLAVQLLTAMAGARAALRGRWLESAAWFMAAFLPPVDPVVTAPVAWGRLAVAAGLAATAAAAVRLSDFRRLRWAPAVGLAAFFAIPAIGGVVNYPPTRTPELDRLVEWARASTPKDAVFLFPDAGRAFYPGVFRAEALRAVYVDWKGGGQVNFLRHLGEEWSVRWQQTGAGRFRPGDMQKYAGMGIDYVVLKAPHRLARAAAFEDPGYAVYGTR
jgi:hypothetical protein